MKILGIETSTELGSLALVEEGEVLAQGDIDTYLKQSARLIPLLDELLEGLGWEIKNLEGIGIGLGPGSFTGIRVGLAVAQGIAYGRKIPLCGVGSFEALAMGASSAEGKVAIISDARRGRLYGALYEKRRNSLQELKPPRIMTPEEAVVFCDRARVISPNGERLENVIEEAVGKESPLEVEKAFPRAEWIARIAEERLKKKTSGEIKKITPIYLSNYTRVKR